MNNLLKDSTQLAENILDTVLPSAEWTVVNIAKHSERVFSVPGDEEVPDCFGYTFDNVPKYLEENGVIEARVPNAWFIRFYDSNNRSDIPIHKAVVKDNIGEVARKNGYIGESMIGYYHHNNTYDENYKRIIKGSMAILINVEALRKFLKIENHPKDRDYWYEGEQLKFRLAGGGTDQFDFSKAKKSRKMFETFWTLWNSDASGEYQVNQIITKYKELFKETLESGRIGEIVSNIRPSIINPKPLIKDRIEWRYVHKNKTWIFKISPLNS